MHLLPLDRVVAVVVALQLEPKMVVILVAVAAGLAQPQGQADLAVVGVVLV
jgi:hypothetical protein